MAESKDGTTEDCKEKDAAYLKRREQVRRAQRTHRERKEAYIKSLENEIQQQRANESRAHQEKQHLQSEVGRLRGILEQHGIAHGGSSIDTSAAWRLSDTSVAPTTPSIGSHSDAHHQPRSPFSGLTMGTPNELYSSESDIFPEMDNGVGLYRDAALFAGQEDSDLDSGDPNSPPGNLALSSEVSAISTYTSQLGLEDLGTRSYRAELVPQPQSHSPFQSQNSYYPTPLSQSPAGHASIPPTTQMFQQYTSHPVSTNNIPCSGSWSTSSTAAGPYNETHHLPAYQYGSPDGGSPQHWGR